MARKEQPIRVGIIGTGGIAEAVHIPNYKALGANIVAVSDVVEERAKRVAHQHGIPHAFADYRQILKRDDVDAVSICVPTFLHAPITMEALRAGKHVLCEKPPARNAREMEKVVEVAKKSRRVLMYALQFRYRRDTQVLRQMVQRGELGKVYYGRAIYLRRRGAPGGWFSEKAKSGGGPLIDIGVHMIDCTWFCMGNPKPVSAFGATFQGIGKKGVKLTAYQPRDIREGLQRDFVFDVEDFAAGIIRFEDGSCLMLEISWMLNTKNDTWGVDVFGREGGAHFPPLEIYREVGGQEADVRIRLPEDDGYRAEINHFLECICKGKKPISPPEDAMTLMKMLDAIYRSAEMGKEVAIR